MIDPRSELISLFSDSRIGAASKYSTTSVYVKLLETEGQEEKEPNDYGSKYVGIIWLHPPRSYLQQITACNIVRDEGETVVDCHLYLPKNQQWFIPGGYGTYIRRILDTFQTTIRNATVDSYSWDKARLNSVPDSLTGGDNPNVYGRVVEVVCINID